MSIFNPTLDELMETNIFEIHLDDPIYRVFPIHRLKDIIARKEMGLVRPSKWDDPFENFFLRCKVRISASEIASLENLYRSWYGQCWTVLEDSDAMWRIYSPNRNGVRVATTVRQLFQAVCNPSDLSARLRYFIGKVTYDSRGTIEAFLQKISFRDIVYGGNNDRLAKLLCVKRKEFYHEEEVRLLYCVDSSTATTDVLSVPFDYGTILTGNAVLDPRIESAEFENLKNQLEGCGWRLPIIQSELYKLDEVIIPAE